MFGKLVSGEQIETTVIAITDDTIFIDLNAKSEGVVEKSEFTDENGRCTVKEGDKIKVFYIGESHGEMKFVAKIKGESADKDMLENAFKNHIPIEGCVEKEIKGGFEVKIGSSRAFCPFSQMGGRQKEENESFVGKVLPFLISEFKENGKNILVSNRAIIEEDRAKHISALSQKITEGVIVEGVVKSFHSFGAFVDIDGFQALLPISEISFERVKEISDVLSIGQKIRAKVIHADWQKKRVSISMKALESDPWNEVSKKCAVGDKFDGVISKIMDFGVFVNLDKGIDGLVHISALEGVDKNTNLKKKFKVGEKMSVVVKEVKANEKRISLVPATSVEQDNSAATYLHSQSDGETYNPFAALLKK